MKENFDMTAPCTCCGEPRPCACELLLYQEVIGKKVIEPAQAEIKKPKQTKKSEGDK